MFIKRGTGRVIKEETIPEQFEREMAELRARDGISSRRAERKLRNVDGLAPEIPEDDEPGR